MKSILAVVVLLFTTQAFAESPRRYIVEFTPGSRSVVREELRGERRFHVRREFSRVLNGAAIELAEGVSIDEIARLPYVARVTPDAIVTAYGVRGRDARTSAGGTPAVRSEDGEGIVVAVIDTGVDRHHPALAGKVIGGYDFVNDDDDPMDDHRHGTHVAGIIAASSATMTGVAPGVSLLAYKVLDHTGSGEASSVIAGIERAVADGADVINLSLGKGGHPDDPTARAVDAATAAGVVVVAAVGNTGEFHSIGSPAAAATAIAVGAAQDATTLAEFSARGPANRSGAIKPEVLAPGVSILSTVLNGEFGYSSGTSMATPYVSGVAALLLVEHPEWTPARVKAALTSTALPVANAEVMAQGTGRVDFARATASDIVIAPGQIHFGLDGGLAPLWSSTRTISIRNESTATRTIRLRNESELWVHLPAEVTLAAGETRDVEVAIEIDHRILGKPQTRSFSFGGWIVLEWDGGDARVPWAFVRAARAVVTYPDVRPFVLWNTEERYGSLAPEMNGVEALLEPGVYDLVAMTERNNDVRIFVSEEQTITGEVMFALTEAQAPHAVKLDGVDARGLPLALPAVRARFVLPGASIVLPSFGRTLHTSSFSSKYALLAIEASFEGNTMHIVQHAPLRGVAEDATLRNQPTELEEKAVRLRFPDAKPRSILMRPRDWPRRSNEFGPASDTFTTTSTESEWTLRLRMTPEHEGDFVGGLQVSAFVDNVIATELITPMIRRDAAGFFATWDFDRPAIADTTLDYGGGAIHAVTNLVSTDSGFGGMVEIRGEGGELRRNVATSYRITDLNDVEIAKGDVAFQTFFAPLPGAGRYRAELRAGGSTMRMEFSSGKTVPSLRSLAVDRDALVLTADAEPHVFFRRRGASAWVQLTPVAEGDVYRVDLDDVVRISRDVEFAIELIDTNGSSISWVTPVVIPTAKRRAMRR